MRELPGPSRAAYLLDFDGTLVDIAAAPDQVWIEPGLAADLRRLRALCGDAVAIVTGRPIAQVDALLPNAAYAIAGEHGTAIRHAPGEEITAVHLDPIPPGWLDAAQAMVAAHPGAMLEHKLHGFVLHYRAAPLAEDALQAGLAALLREVPGRYALMPAKMAWEVRPAGVDKGVAVRALMAQAPFAGRVPIFVGDDVTDEDGMDAARALGGVGLRVPEVFGEPEGVRKWLRQVVLF